MTTEIIWFKDCSYSNKHLVGGKCSSLGELYKLSQISNFSIADGFAISIDLYNQFIDYNNLLSQLIYIVNLSSPKQL